MRSPLFEQVLLVAAFAAAAGSFAWFGWPESSRGRKHRQTHGGAKMGAAYVAAESGTTAVAPGKWLPPVAQARGPQWRYDVFTPPEISYDANTRQFVVSRPGPAAECALSGIELVAVQRASFRLQLVGYVGRAGQYLGTFENQLSGEVFLAGAGRKVLPLGLVITDFEVERRPVALADHGNSNQWVATAVVRDERTGASTRLTAGERSYTDELRAWVTTGDDEDVLRELRPGEEVQGAGQNYILQRLQLDPPTAELTQVSPSPESPTIRLGVTPAMSAEALAVKPPN